MDKKSKVVPLSKESATCVVCGSSNVETKQVDDSFEYGSVFLNATITVHSCAECSFEFTGEGADSARHESVCRHLGLLTPAEVRNIRKDMSMSKAELARQTGIGEASLSRWERGYLLQNTAMDNFLYLLSLPGNLEALQKRHSDSGHMEPESVFQCIGITSALREQQAKFSF
ncbi:MAG: type II toxin-antitoxin system MqsA family antitoxin [Candidatus Dadabacteria bacterium]|nr:type II toxin-antitoxin system MqsA family antitoxin [Candidatus Dadabacteria bacterium]MDE0519117.1 type II toxin-antitoxin system MqsA family antitoxin [Candidatus Dadabacteria bacterium]MDE0662686.1 type II toxin-antitoxin system MqsA family antitoxin [Candidatus Dadabacteria bacterium]